MEKYALEEARIQEQLHTYQTQLTAVTTSLNDDSFDEKGELKALQADLEELISLTQESLLELKKQILLSSLEDHSNNKSKETGSEVSSVGGASDLPLQEEEESETIQGMKCRAPFEEGASWRGVAYHNAMILWEESEEKVRVLFTHPRFDSMKPCSFYLEGNCKFTDQTCRYSHGHLVSVDQLQPFSDPAFDSLHSGSRCLAKHTDDLWHDAFVRSCGDILTVQFTTVGKGEVELNIEDILPLSGSDDSSSSSNDTSSDEDGVTIEDVRVIDWKPTNMVALGEWEQYTTGIGSKLLTKMGYIIGQGLGKSNQGRLEPVPIEILPAGKSLDACVAIKKERQRRGDRKGRKRKRKKKISYFNKKSSTNDQGSTQSMDVFGFLNTKLGQDSKETTSTSRKKVKHNTGKSKNLNVELFKIQENITNFEKKIKGLRSRNNDRKDKRVEEHIDKKLKSAEKELHIFQKQERLVMSRMKRKTDETKLSVF